MGKAALDYMQGKRNIKIKVHSNIAEDDFIPVDYLFRSHKQMPEIEQKALIHCKGKVLDVGAGVGSHALYLQQKGSDVVCIDTSKGCLEAAKQRGIKNYYQVDLFDFNTDHKYDTILLMMNGIGLVGTIDRLNTFFQKAKDLLAPGGQILLDSSDLRYLYIDEDSYLIPIGEKYYGEIIYTTEYDNIKSKPFPWLFIDENLLAEKARENSFSFEKLADGPHYDYLGRLELIK